MPRRGAIARRTAINAFLPLMGSIVGTLLRPFGLSVPVATGRRTGASWLAPNFTDEPAAVRHVGLTTSRRSRAFYPLTLPLTADPARFVAATLGANHSQSRDAVGVHAAVAASRHHHGLARLPLR
jgi:hypothetical protein